MTRQVTKLVKCDNCKKEQTGPETGWFQLVPWAGHCLDFCSWNCIESFVLAKGKND